MIPGCGIDFERATENPQSMSLTQSARAGIRDALGVVKLIAGLVLLVALSWEIIAGDHVHVSRTYLAIQFVVCLVFLCDFFVRWAAAERPGRFFWRNLPFLLLSDPELQAIQAYGVWHEKTMCGKTSMGVVRTTYVIDENGVIEWAKEKVKPDANAGEILEYLG